MTYCHRTIRMRCAIAFHFLHLRECCIDGAPPIVNGSAIVHLTFQTCGTVSLDVSCRFSASDSGNSYLASISSIGQELAVAGSKLMTTAILSTAREARELAVSRQSVEAPCKATSGRTLAKQGIPVPDLAEILRT